MSRTSPADRSKRQFLAKAQRPPRTARMKRELSYLLVGSKDDQGFLVESIPSLITRGTAAALRETTTYQFVLPKIDIKTRS